MDKAHKNPAANIAINPNFLFVLIWRRQTDTIGSSKIEKSESTLTIAVMRTRDSMFTHFPGVSGSQIFRLGEHSNISTMVSTK